MQYDCNESRGSPPPRLLGVLSLSGYPATTISSLLSYIRVRLRVGAAKISNAQFARCQRVKKAETAVSVYRVSGPGEKKKKQQGMVEAGRRGKRERKRERGSKAEGRLKRTRGVVEQDSGECRQGFEPRLAGPCYISPERPCCFFNARTTFTLRDGRHRERRRGERAHKLCLVCLGGPSTIACRRDDQSMYLRTGIRPLSLDTRCWCQSFHNRLHGTK